MSDKPTFRSAAKARARFDALTAKQPLQGELGTLSPKHIAEHTANSPMLTPDARDSAITRELRSANVARSSAVVWTFLRACRDALALVGIGAIIAAAIRVMQH